MDFPRVYVYDTYPRIRPEWFLTDTGELFKTSAYYPAANPKPATAYALSQGSVSYLVESDGHWYEAFRRPLKDWSESWIPIPRN